MLKIRPPLRVIALSAITFPVMAAAQARPFDNCYLPAAASARPSCLGAVYFDGLARLAELPAPTPLPSPLSGDILKAASETSYRLLERIRISREVCHDLTITAGTSQSASEFVADACTGFELAASADSTANAEMIGSLKGQTPQTLGAQVEIVARQRQQAEASSRLMFLAGTGLADALLEESPGTDRMRLAMTPAEREALLAKARGVAGLNIVGQEGTVYSQIAAMLVADFFSQPWLTR